MVVEVTPNVAFGLVDSGKAIKVVGASDREIRASDEQRDTLSPSERKVVDDSVDASDPTASVHASGIHYPTRQIRAEESASVQPKPRKKGYKTA